jgi:hypothetical protein
MTTTKSAKLDVKTAFTNYAVYLPLGAGQLVIEKSKEFSGKAMTMAQQRREEMAKVYRDLAKRGEKLVKSIRISPYTQRAVDQTKIARGQVKAAAKKVS